jgi:hypothetical protein
VNRCIFCGEQIQLEAIKCRFCGEFLQARESLPIAESPPIRAPDSPRSRWALRRLGVISVAVFVAVVATIFAVTRPPSRDERVDGCVSLATDWAHRVGFNVATVDEMRRALYNEYGSGGLNVVTFVHGSLQLGGVGVTDDPGFEPALRMICEDFAVPE